MHGRPRGAEEGQQHHQLPSRPLLETVDCPGEKEINRVVVVEEQYQVPVCVGPLQRRDGVTQGQDGIAKGRRTIAQSRELLWLGCDSAAF